MSLLCNGGQKAFLQDSCFRIGKMCISVSWRCCWKLLCNAGQKVFLQDFCFRNGKCVFAAHRLFFQMVFEHHHFICHTSALYPAISLHSLAISALYPCYIPAISPLSSSPSRAAPRRAAPRAAPRRLRYIPAISTVHRYMVAISPLYPRYIPLYFCYIPALYHRFIVACESMCLVSLEVVT